LATTALSGARGFSPPNADTTVFDPHDVMVDSKVKVTIARQGQKAQERRWSFRWGDAEARKHAFAGDSKYRMSMGLH
jgi:hypothetical protein